MKVNDQDFYISWYYRKICGIADDLPFVKSTECKVFSNNMLIGFGITYCSKNDNFNRKIGRKISLTRAISKLDKSTRKEIWDNYWKQVRKK
jgi:hypothetical protein